MQSNETPLAVSNYLQEQLTIANDQIRSWSRVRGFLLSAIDQVQRDEEPDTTAPVHPIIPATKPPETYDTDLSMIQVDFSEAKNNTERLFLIAQEAWKRGKLVSTTDLGQYFIDHDLTSANLHNAKTIASQVISDFGSQFERIRPGLYRYTPTFDSVQVTDDPSGDELSVIQ